MNNEPTMEPVTGTVINDTIISVVMPTEERIIYPVYCMMCHCVQEFYYEHKVISFVIAFLIVFGGCVIPLVYISLH
jgi:hypothetical protein